MPAFLCLGVAALRGRGELTSEDSVNWVRVKVRVRVRVRVRVSGRNFLTREITLQYMKVSCARLLRPKGACLFT